MAEGSKTVSVSRDLYDAASETAALFGRTVVEQIEHWVRLGRALEASPSTTRARIIPASKRGRIRCLRPNSLHFASSRP